MDAHKQSHAQMTDRRLGLRRLLITSVVLAVAAFSLSAGAPDSSLSGPSAAKAETYWSYTSGGATYKDNWSSWYYRRIYYHNYGCDAHNHFSANKVGVKFIRISDGADLYRYIGWGCQDSGIVPSGTCRWAFVANAGTVTWLDLTGDGDHYGSC